MNDQLVYKEMILDLYKNPLHFKKLENPTLSLKGHNPSCGDSFSYEFVISEGIITDIGFHGVGCAISTAASSLITDYVIGKSINDVKAITEDEMIEMLGILISYGRMKCALLGLITIQRAI